MKVVLVVLCLFLYGCAETGLREYPHPSNFATAVGAHTLIILSDPGGYIVERELFMESIDPQVSIELADKCYSACTMYLSRPNVCVFPSTILFFHGPARKKTPLSKEEFDRDSIRMARHYPAPIAEWFMSTGRHVQGNQFYTVRGSELIEKKLVRDCTI